MPKDDENGFSTCVDFHTNCRDSWVCIKFYNQILLLHKNSEWFTIKLVCPGQQSWTCVFCVWDLDLINPLAWPPLPLINTAIRANSQWPGEMVHIWETSVSHTLRHLSISPQEQRNFLKAHSDCSQHTNTLAHCVYHLHRSSLVCLASLCWWLAVYN